MTDLSQFIERTSSCCLNEQDDHSLGKMLAGEGFLLSDADEQLLVTVGFSEAVKPRTIRLKVSPECLDNAPAAVHVFVNQRSLDFSDAESLKPAQSFVLTRGDYGDSGEAVLNLKYVLFQHVTVLSLFIASNLGDADETRLDKILLSSGEPGQKKQLVLLDTAQQFDHAIADSSAKAVFVDFFAGWCGPCRRISPVFAELADEYASKGAKCYKVDIDKNKDSAKKFDVSSVPYFAVFKGGNKVADLKGANAEGLRQLFTEHTQ